MGTTPSNERLRSKAANDARARRSHTRVDARRHDARANTNRVGTGMSKDLSPNPSSSCLRGMGSEPFSENRAGSNTPWPKKGSDPVHVRLPTAGTRKWALTPFFRLDKKERTF